MPGPSPIAVNPLSATEIRIDWSTGERFALPYIDLRFECPCAVCVDEKTGVRVIKRESIRPNIQVLAAQVVGRYAIQFNWNDGHSTGIYHFETLHEICLRSGLRVA